MKSENIEYYTGMTGGHSKSDIGTISTNLTMKTKDHIPDLVSISG